MVTDKDILITVVCLVVSIAAYVLICGLETWINNRAAKRELQNDDSESSTDNLP